MMDTVQEAMLCLTAINGDQEACGTIYSPSLVDLTQRLDAVRAGLLESRCIECSVRIAGDIGGELTFIRVNEPTSGQFYGWIVQLGSSEEYASFTLARMHEPQASAARAVEFMSCVDLFDSRCLLSHSQLIEWLQEELEGNDTSNRYRWIDVSIALDEMN